MYLTRVFNLLKENCEGQFISQGFVTCTLINNLNPTYLARALQKHTEALLRVGKRSFELGYKCRGRFLTED